MSGSLLLTLPDRREHVGRMFGLCVVIALLLHGLFVAWLSMPHKSSGGGMTAASVDMENVHFADQTATPDAPTDMSYRPEVANVLPQAGAGGDAAGPDNAGAQAKMNVDQLDAGEAGGGDVLKVGDGKSLDDLLALPKAGGAGKPGVGYRIKQYPPTVPFYKVEVKPTPIKVPVPLYPDAVRTAGIEGSVVVEALLDLDGSVMDSRVQKSSGNEQLDEAACDAAKLAKFTPAKQRDNPVRVWISIPYHFTLH
ncbi:MAG TPA: energy transducer TonB [bacterium]|nr:energy transducer TonB [bacterium]